MWDIYNDDESFQRIARGRGYHDAKLLAKVLYGKQAKQNLNQNEKLEAKSSNTKKLNVHFCQNVGKLVLDSAMLSEEEHENDFDFMWRTQDYSFQTIKINEDFNRDEDRDGYRIYVYTTKLELHQLRMIKEKYLVFLVTFCRKQTACVNVDFYKKKKSYKIRNKLLLLVHIRQMNMFFP